MAESDVIRYGTDPNGRAVLMTVYMRDWWRMVCRDLGFEPTIVQGAWMARAGGGAAASAGYHDGGGCLDLRVWNLTLAQQEETVRTLRRLGAAAWQRDPQHGGMDPHIHLVLGTDYGLTSGPRWQWARYQAGRDGLASDGPDYHWRPDPLVLVPPEEDPLAQYEKQLSEMNDKLDKLLKLHDNDAAIRTKLKRLVQQLVEGRGTGK